MTRQRTSDAIAFYGKAKTFVLSSGFGREVDWQRSVRFTDCTEERFFWEYVWVVLSAGMKNQIARKIHERFKRNFPDFTIIGHIGKRKAIQQIWREYPQHFARLQLHRTVLSEVLEILDALPWIGPITKYHLAKNLGFQVAKPDRHLLRITKHFDYPDVQAMCTEIGNSTGDSIPVVDLILWRYANLNGTKNGFF